MSLSFDVIVVGSYSVDLIFSGMSEFPQLGKDVVSSDFKMTPGEAFIPAVAMHRLGLKVGWATDFGNDDFSQFALKYAREEGLDDSLFVFHDRPFRRISVSASFPGDNAYLTYYDADPQIPAAVLALRKSRAQVLFIPGLYYGPFLEIGINLIRIKKMELVMDGNSSSGTILGRSRESAAIRNAINYADVFLPNAKEARRLAGEDDLEQAIYKLAELCPQVVIKDGSNGSIAYFNKNLIRMPGISINPADTTGAGDNFNAGFLYAWLNHYPTDTCLKWGNITGGLSTMEMGGTTRKITIEEVNKVLISQYNNSSLVVQKSVQ
jgi:sugar/nucleoside kinase (ribokinase family)